jgi:hypothetical protein
MSDLERTISMFRQQQQQPPQPQQLQMPQFPPASQPAAAQGIDFQKILAVLNAQKQMQQPQQPAVMPPVQPSQPSIAPNLAAIISQFAGASQQSGPNPAQMPGHYEDPERKRMREGPGYDGPEDDRYSYFKRNKPNGANKVHVSCSLRSFTYGY